MLKDILEKKGLSVYKLSKDTGIAYSTINDIVIEKTDIKNVSANMLYRMSKYLEISMEVLYEGSLENTVSIHLYNEGRNVILVWGRQRIQYLGPKNLLCFHRINRIENHVVYADCYFLDEHGKIYSEEDFIDLEDVMSGVESILEREYEVLLGQPNTSEREILINKSLLVSDNLGIIYFSNQDIPDVCVKVVSLARPKSSAIIRLKDLSVVSSTMSKALLNRAIRAVERNRDEIREEVEEVLKYA